ncbi:MAG: putative beta-lysine N-acetyltransferase [Methanolobus sp.]
MTDQVVKIGSSVIQHGPFNDRVYLMKLSPDDFGSIPETIETLSMENSYSKICSKIPVSAIDYFRYYGHVTEARIPGFYNGEEDAVFMAKFLSKDRREEKNILQRKNVLETALLKSGQQKDVTLSGDEKIFICGRDDAREMAELYSRVFPSYPFPIQDEDYLIGTMQENLVYFCIRRNTKLVAIASCEVDVKNSNVEMTDFATLSEFRGNGYSYYLLEEMEKEMRKRGIKTAYTIARAVSYGMNTVFSRSSYIYAGTLVNNTNISGGIESMNIWYKKLVQT